MSQQTPSTSSSSSMFGTTLIVHTYYPDTELRRTTFVTRQNMWLQRSLEACSCEHVITAISSGADVNHRDSSGCTPLHKAVEGDAHMAELLVGHGADVNAQNAQGDTPLHAAVQAGNAEAVALLLYHDADANQVNKYGWTPFTLALMVHNEQIQRMLLPYEADFNRVDKYGRSVLTFAVKATSKLVLEILKGGAVYYSKDDSPHGNATTVDFFQRLWSAVDFTGSFETDLGILPNDRLAEVVEFIANADHVSRVLDDMHAFRLQGRLPCCRDSRGARNRGLINKLLERFPPGKVCELTYIFTSYGYNPNYIEAERIFDKFGRNELYNFIVELDLIPSRMSRHYLLPVVTLDVKKSIKAHVHCFLLHKVKTLDYLQHMYLNLTSILPFFTNDYCSQMLTHFVESGGELDMAFTEKTGMAEVLKRKIPSLQELCRDFVRDHICTTHNLCSWVKYRRLVGSLHIGSHTKILTFQKPLYEVDKGWLNYVQTRITAYKHEYHVANN